jgi:hypothetical protein
MNETLKLRVDLKNNSTYKNFDWPLENLSSSS